MVLTFLQNAVVGQVVTIPPREDAENGREEVHGERGLPLDLFVWLFLISLALFLWLYFFVFHPFIYLFFIFYFYSLFFLFCLSVQWAPYGSAEGQKYLDNPAMPAWRGTRSRTKWAKSAADGLGAPWQETALGGPALPTQPERWQGRGRDGSKGGLRSGDDSAMRRNEIESSEKGFATNA